MHDWAVVLGRRLRSARLAARSSQRRLGAEAGVHQSVISRMELGRGGNVDLDTWAAVAGALGLHLELSGGEDGDARLATHRMVADLATRGGWAAVMAPDETILRRGDDRAIVHVWETVTIVEPDVARFRQSLEREQASGIVVIPAVGLNRRRVSEVRDELRDVFPAQANAWYAALVNRHRPMPRDPGILWAFPDRGRLRPATLLPGWIWTAVGDAPRFVTGRRD